MIENNGRSFDFFCSPEIDAQEREDVPELFSLPCNLTPERVLKNNHSRELTQFKIHHRFVQIFIEKQRVSRTPPPPLSVHPGTPRAPSPSAAAAAAWG